MNQQKRSATDSLNNSINPPDKKMNQQESPKNPNPVTTQKEASRVSMREQTAPDRGIIVSSQTSHAQQTPMPSGRSSPTMTVNKQLVSAIIAALQSPEIRAMNESTLKHLFDQQTKSLTATLSNMENEIDSHKSKICALESKVDQLEQYSRKNSIRIQGLPEDTDEDTPKIIVQFFNEEMKTSITNIDLDNAHRLGRVNEINRTSPRDIIVKFTSYLKKEELMQKRSSLKRNPKTSKIYINDDLTPTKAKIFHLTRLLQKEKKIVNTWNRDGVTFIKQSESSKPLPVKSVEQLDRIKQILLDDNDISHSLLSFYENLKSPLRSSSYKHTDMSLSSQESNTSTSY